MRRTTATVGGTMPSDAATRPHALPPDVLAMLALPDPAMLTEDQRRGSVCVWGDDRLDNVTAVDLGVQDEPRRWFPRACPTHAADRAHRALFDHAAMCEQCVDAAEHCETSRVLYRLVREGRR
ncbi:MULTISPECIES: hypothetical protein [unclassified Streptomyces]|uniref:hypothetical protein n=1 Tax=unclassified Streptomyces TaxID=2593676 RepID=UPI0027E5B708|nr:MULTISPECIES: hypothetical protein [unclassified Streptomyces]